MEFFATGAFWNNNFYIAGVNGHLVAYAFNSSTNLFTTPHTTQSSTSPTDSQGLRLPLPRSGPPTELFGPWITPITALRNHPPADQPSCMPMTRRIWRQNCGTAQWPAGMPPVTRSNSQFQPLRTGRRTSEPVVIIRVVRMVQPAFQANLTSMD